MKRIYLDSAAATSLDRLVSQAMRQAEKLFGNPSSLSAEGVAAARALATARERIARAIGAQADEIVFTSGGTESNNLALRGVGGPFLISAIEHPSVRQVDPRAAVAVVEASGLLDLAKFKEALTPKTRLVSIIYANNEIGTIQPLRDVAKIIRQHRRLHGTRTPYLHTDACQAARFLDLNVNRLGVDLMTFNAAKLYGPKGIGVLYVRRGVPLKSQILGGGQEAGRRAGTENLTLINGLALALELAQKRSAKEAARLTMLRDYFIKAAKKLPGVSLNGHPTRRLPNNINLQVTGIEAEQLVIELDARGVAASTGSACSLINHDESYVIMALGQSAEAARSAIRFSLDRETTKADLDKVLALLGSIIIKLRQFAN